MKQLTKKQQRRMYRLWSNYHSYVEISKKLDISTSTVKRYTKRYFLNHILSDHLRPLTLLNQGVPIYDLEQAYVRKMNIGNFAENLYKSLEKNDRDIWKNCEDIIKNNDDKVIEKLGLPPMTSPEKSVEDLVIEELRKSGKLTGK